MKITFNKLVTCLAGLGALCSACGDDADPDLPFELTVPTHYTFESRFAAEESVAYAGQTFRHVLISDLKRRIDGLTQRIDNGTLTPTTGDVIAELDYYYDFDGASSGSGGIGLTTTPKAKQATYAELHEGTSLSKKIAGNDPEGQHKNWDTDLIGWDAPGVTSPHSLIRTWFAAIEHAAIERANGRVPTDFDGNRIDSVYVTASGQDLSQLTQKLLLGAIAYSQGTDDYLDDTIDGKGLKSDNAERVAGESFTELEHAWDEGFGYFGAARDYADYDDDEIAGKGGRDGYSSGYHDTNTDGAIDLRSEFNFGHSVNAAKRDRGSAASAKTDFTKAAIVAFTSGRAMITSAGGALDAAQMAYVVTQRDKLVDAWERAIASTVVHYINELIRDMAKHGTADFSFADYAKHWSELKGFALSLQFNPRSALDTGKLTELNTLLGTAPAAPADQAAYKAKLLDARAILVRGYAFDAANVGDADGNNGW